MPEEPVILTGGAFRLFAVLHPASGSGRAAAEGLPAFVLCPPFAEEKKGAHRLLVEVARGLAAAGVPALRFDYRGTGDSAGTFTDFTVSGAVEDTCQAIAFLCARSRAESVGLLGVRLGAAIAARAALACGVSVAQLIFWEPVVNGRHYVRMNLRLRRIRAMVGAAERSQVGRLTAPTQLETTGYRAADGYDFDGYWITPGLHAELEALEFPGPPETRPLRVLGVSVNAAGRVSPDLERLGARYAATGALTDLHAVSAEPFWSLQDPVPVPDLVRLSVDWATQLQRRDGSA